MFMTHPEHEHSETNTCNTFTAFSDWLIDIHTGTINYDLHCQ